jgi:hypothetical protein
MKPSKSISGGPERDSRLLFDPIFTAIREILLLNQVESKENLKVVSAVLFCFATNDGKERQMKARTGKPAVKTQDTHGQKLGGKLFFSGIESTLYDWKCTPRYFSPGPTTEV